MLCNEKSSTNYPFSFMAQDSSLILKPLILSQLLIFKDFWHLYISSHTLLFLTQLPIDETISWDFCYFPLCSIWHLLGWWQMKTEINVLLMLCIYSGKDRLLLQNKTVIMFLSLVSGSFGSMNKSYVSPLHATHLFSRLCHVTQSFEHSFCFFLSTPAKQWWCILIPDFFQV